MHLEQGAETTDCEESKNETTAADSDAPETENRTTFLEVAVVTETT